MEALRRSSLSWPVPSPPAAPRPRAAATTGGRLCCLSAMMFLALAVLGGGAWPKPLAQCAEIVDEEDAFLYNDAFNPKPDVRKIFRIAIKGSLDPDYQKELSRCAFDMEGPGKYLFFHEELDVGQLRVRYPAFAPAATTPLGTGGTVLTGAEALKAALSRETLEGCSKNRSVGALFVLAGNEPLSRKPVFGKPTDFLRRMKQTVLATAHRAGTRFQNFWNGQETLSGIQIGQLVLSAILYSMSAVVAFHPKTSRLLHTLKRVGITLYGKLSEIEEEVHDVLSSELLNPELRLAMRRVFTDYGDFLALELSGKAPRVVQSFMLLLVRGLDTRSPDETETPPPQRRGSPRDGEGLGKRRPRGDGRAADERARERQRKRDQIAAKYNIRRGDRTKRADRDRVPLLSPSETESGDEGIQEAETSGVGQRRRGLASLQERTEGLRSKALDMNRAAAALRQGYEESGFV